jgi:hypothetical protein
VQLKEFFLINPKLEAKEVFQAKQISDRSRNDRPTIRKKQQF